MINAWTTYGSCITNIGDLWVVGHRAASEAGSEKHQGGVRKDIPATAVSGKRRNTPVRTIYSSVAVRVSVITAA